MNWSKFVRQSHRWISIVFTVTVLVNVVALIFGSQAVWIGLLALFPLILLLITGLYLFVLPYAVRWRSAERAGENGGELARN